MEKKLEAWVDKKMVVSIALGVLLAGLVAWFGGVILSGFGLGHSGMQYGMKGGMQQRGDMRGMRDRMMQRDVQYNDNGAAGTFMEGSDIPADLDTSAM